MGFALHSQVYIIRAYNLEDKENTHGDSDVTQLERNGKGNTGSGKGDHGEDSNVSLLEKSGKKVTRSSGRKTRANKSEDKAANGEDSGVSQLETSGKRTTRSASKGIIVHIDLPSIIAIITTVSLSHALNW